MTALWIPPVYGDTGASVRLLRAYFTRRRAKGDHYYTGAHFERLAGGGDRPETADAFTADDLLAITMLSVSVEPHGAVELLTDPDGHWGRLLSAIPRDARLEDPASAPLIAPGGPAAELWDRLANPRAAYPGKPDGVGPVVAGKLLARKRPHLIPVYDIRVKALFRRPKVDTTFWSALADALRADGGAFRARLAELRTEAGIGEDIGVLRVLDVIAWMHQGEAGQATG
ncbi:MULTISPECIES: DUF6308 family protein [Streptomycetaceae]|uniref:DUF6308 family protein n=1 Tax=Streptomycetaceae TaxID=2062 RepID=UPI0009395E2E|nr:DUF6308 family protein [Streptomyces sp. CB02056]OKI02911.1 hypothetical protein AMK13_30430 [Streptomyces sp. CB02056]